MSKPYTITTAISYPNGRPHIGHAYEVIATDAIARFQRMMGRDVFFQTGTAEHGLKLAQTARSRAMEPRALADEIARKRVGQVPSLSVQLEHGGGRITIKQK